MASKAPQPDDPLFALAEHLRSKGGVEVRSGVLAGQRVEFFRGKDFARWVKANPAKAGPLLPAGRSAEDDDAPRSLAGLLLRRGLVARCERQVKRPPPGSKKLVKFPKKLLPAERSDAQTFAEESFYHYTYERPASVWTYVWAGLAVVGVLAGCLFPLAPAPVKLAVFYLSAGLLIAILGLLLVRGVVAAATWIVSGSTLWLLPNIMNEEVPLTQLFKPLVSLQPRNPDSKWGSHPLTRAAVGVALGGLLYMLHAHTDSKAVARTVLHSRDELLDWLNINPDIKQLANTSHAFNDTAAPANATANVTAGDAAGEGSGGADSADADAEADQAAAEADQAAAAKAAAEAGEEDAAAAGTEEL